jgi:hypothetical protein
VDGDGRVSMTNFEKEWRRNLETLSLDSFS